MTNAQLRAKKETHGRHPNPPANDFQKNAENAFKRRRKGEPHPGAKPATRPELANFVLTNTDLFVTSRENGNSTGTQIQAAKEIISKYKLTPDQAARVLKSVTELIEKIKERFPNADIKINVLVLHKVTSVLCGEFIDTGCATNPWGL